MEYLPGLHAALGFIIRKNERKFPSTLILFSTWEVEIILCYMVSSRPAWAMTLSQKSKKQNQKIDFFTLIYCICGSTHVDIKKQFVCINSFIMWDPDIKLGSSSKTASAFSTEPSHWPWVWLSCVQRTPTQVIRPV